MHKIYIACVILCFNSLSFSMANTGPSPEDIIATITTLKQRGKKTQQDHSQKEERMKIEHQKKKEEIKQAILGTFPGTPTPDSLKELQRIHIILKEKLKKEILNYVPDINLPDDLHELKIIHNALFSNSDKVEP